MTPVTKLNQEYFKMKMEEIMKSSTYQSDFSNTNHKVCSPPLLLCFYILKFSIHILSTLIITVHFYCFIFCFIFYCPIVDIIVNHLYVLTLRLRKTNTECFSKNEINPQRYHLGVAS